MVFPVIVGEPPEINIPIHPCPIDVVAPVKFIEPILLLLTFTIPAPEYEIILADPPVV